MLTIYRNVFCWNSGVSLFAILAECLQFCVKSLYQEVKRKSIARRKSIALQLSEEGETGTKTLNKSRFSKPIKESEVPAHLWKESGLENLLHGGFASPPEFVNLALFALVCPDYPCENHQEKSASCSAGAWWI